MQGYLQPTKAIWQDIFPPKMMYFKRCLMYLLVYAWKHFLVVGMYWMCFFFFFFFWERGSEGGGGGGGVLGWSSHQLNILLTPLHPFACLPSHYMLPKKCWFSCLQAVFGHFSQNALTSWPQLGNWWNFQQIKFLCFLLITKSNHLELGETSHFRGKALIKHETTTCKLLLTGRHLSGLILIILLYFKIS